VSRLRRALEALVTALVALASPAAAAACSVCMSGRDDDVQAAFAIASAFLTLVPLLMVGGVVFWLRRRARRIAAEEAAGVIRLPDPASRRRSAA
jgi:cbb3-type cytochrome oxidase subunit 3